jgi:hypothetical protein
VKRWILALAFAALSVSVYVLVAVSNAKPPTTSRTDSRTDSRTGIAGWAPAPVAPLAMRRQDRPGLDGAKEAPVEAKGSPSTAPTGEEMRDHIEASFAADPPVAPSQDLAPGLEKRVRAVIPAGSFVRSLECRSSLCRIETMHANLGDFRDFMQRAYLTPDTTTRVSNGPVFAGLLAQPVEGQPVVAVAFLGREGTILPTLTPAAPAGNP